MKKNSLHRTFLIQLTMVSFLSVLLVGYFWISSEKSKFEKEITVLRDSYIDSQKNILKRETIRALAFVNYMRFQTEERLKDDTKDRVYEAHAIATNIYQKNIGNKSVTEIKGMIKNALRPIRFKQGRGYYFAFDLNGIETLFPVNPEMEGKNMLKVAGGDGEPVVPDMISIVQKENEGFYRYKWPKPGEKGYFPKIAFVKVLKSIGWVIGTGEYIDDVEKDIQRQCIKWISNIKFGNDGYVFAGQWDGVSLSGPASGKNMYHVKDVNGVKIVQELIKTAKSGDGFVNYVLPRFEGKKHAPKISYTIGLPEWQWYIGAGVYVDEIENVISEKRSQLQKRIRKNIRNIIIMLMILSLFIILLIKILSTRIQNNLLLFFQFFKQASDEAVQIDKKALHFSEFDQMAELANDMVEKQRAAEQALQLSHERFLTVFDGLDAIVYVVDIETYEILFMNKYMKEGFGRDMTGEICWQSYRDETGPCSFCPMDKIIDKDGSPGDVHVWQAYNSVSNKWYNNFDRAIEWTDGRIVKLQIATDITEFKKMEEDLRQAHKMEAIGTLAGGVAHDFNNILSIIIGNVELAMDENPETEPTYKKLKRIRTASLRAKNIVKQLLSFSRKLEQERKPIEIARVIIEALTLIKSSTPSNIEIHENIPESKVIVLADATQIHQVLINLCTNATHAMKEDGGLIEVNLRQLFLEKGSMDIYKNLVPGNYLELSVKDTGPGIDSDNLEKIFDPYFTTKEVGKGTGMGLAVVHGIVKNHHGEIFVDSEPDKGSVFTILLPAAPEQTEPAEKTSPAQSYPLGEETILFVDDEEAIVDLAKKILKMLGYKVQASTNPIEALDVFKAAPNHFNLVISDMTMPQMSGVQLSKKIKKIREDIPIIICSGHSSVGDEKEVRDIGISAYANKPITMSEISKLIRRVLDR